MWKTGSAFLLLVLLPASAVFAGAEAQRIVQKAIQAHGGEANVTKLRTMRVKLEGTSYGELGQPNSPVTIEHIWQLPNRHRSSFSFNLMPTKLRYIQVIDGAKGWKQLDDDETEDLSDDLLAELAEQKYAESLDCLRFLRDKATELSLIDEIKVGDKPAVGVLVKAKARRDVKLYFDKTSGLLVKRQHSLFDTGAGDGSNEEVIFSDFQEKLGIKHYMRIIVLNEGIKTLDARVTEIEFFKKLDSKVFAKP